MDKENLLPPILQREHCDLLNLTLCQILACGFWKAWNKKVSSYLMATLWPNKAELVLWYLKGENEVAAGMGTCLLSALWLNSMRGMCPACLNMFQKLYEITRWFKAGSFKKKSRNCKTAFKMWIKEVHYILCNEVNIYSKFDYYTCMFSKKFLVQRVNKHCNIFPARWCSYIAQRLWKSFTLI